MRTKRFLKPGPFFSDRFSDEDFVRVCYEIIFGRAPDEEGLRIHVKSLCRGIPRQQLVRAFLDSPEFSYRLSGKSPLDALHGARMKFVRSLPKAEYIVDLGGASAEGIEGALYVMGYPFPSQRLYIVDLPPGDRIEKPVYRAKKKVVRTEKTTVEYILSSMAELSTIRSESIDLVFSGESIEHIPEEDAQKTISEAYRVLKPGGYFCLDTPNARLTRFQSPDKLIHPEHKKEYYFGEMKGKVLQAGFEIVEVGGICPMRRSLETNRFDLEEMLEFPVLDNDPEVCYLFFIKARKPM